MHRRVALAVVFCGLLVVPAFANAASGISRREGFLLIWQALKRPATEQKKDRYADVPPGTEGATEINYARSRGFLSDDQENFYPDEPITFADAVRWLIRTRNVDDLDKLTPEALPGLALRYGILSREEAKNKTLSSRELSEEELAALVRTFDVALKNEIHEVSLYAEKFHGKGTAFGETFDMNDLTAAHRTYPYNTLVRVTNATNGKSVIVRINDRGPFVQGRDMDLSLASFLSIEDRSKGKTLARFERLGDASIVGVCTRRESFQKRLYRNFSLVRGVPQTLALGDTLVLSAEIPFVVLSERYPDGEVSFVQDWVLPGETFAFTPSVKGEYVFTLGTREGGTKGFIMDVAVCD